MYCKCTWKGLYRRVIKLQESAWMMHFCVFQAIRKGGNSNFATKIRYHETFVLVFWQAIF